MGAPYSKHVQDEALSRMEAARDTARIGAIAGGEVSPGWFAQAINQVSHDLDIVPSTLRRWVKEHGIGPEDASAPSATSEAVSALINLLPNIVTQIIDENVDIKAEVARLPTADRLELVAKVTDKPDALLTPTNPEIIEFARARSAYESFRSRHKAPVTVRQSLNVLRYSVSLWLLPACVAAVWILWPQVMGRTDKEFLLVAVVLLIPLSILLSWIIAPSMALHAARHEVSATPGGRPSPMFESSRGLALFNSIVWGSNAAIILLVWYQLLVRQPFWVWMIILWLVFLLIGGAVNLLAFAYFDEGTDPRAQFGAIQKATLPAFIAYFFAICIAVPLSIALFQNRAGIPLVIASGVMLHILTSWYIIRRSERTSGDLHRLRSRQEEIRVRLEAEVDSALQAWYQAVSEQIEQILRLRIRDAIRPPFSTNLAIRDISGLMYLRSADAVVRTSSFRALAFKLERLAGGTVGIAGARGAGKTTLLEYYRSGRLLEAAGKRHLAVFLNVPVRFEARDFAIYLFGQLCEQVKAYGGASATKRATLVPVKSPTRVTTSLVMTLLVLSTSVSAVSSFLSSRAGLTSADSRVLGLAVASALIAIGCAVALLKRFGAHSGEVDEPEDRIIVADLGTLMAAAEQNLRLVNYQQSHTTGWGGKISTPVGVEGSMTASRQFSRRPLAYPDVVFEIHRFLKDVVSVLRQEPGFSDVPFAIVLDELDKISGAENVQEFLNELKALFALDHPGCLFLVSVSEDALAAFERRGLPVRDVLDSTFDEVLSVPYLTLVDTREILQSRVVGMPDPFICLSHCLSGGLPRDLIRFARDIVDQPAHTDLAILARSIVFEDLRRKAVGLRTLTAAARCREPETTRLLSRLLTPAWSTPSDLLEVAALFEPIEGLPGHADASEIEAVLRFRELEREALTYIYFAATILEVFCDFTPDKLVKGTAKDDMSSFDYLASVRQLFSVNVRLAWEANSNFRRSWSLSTLDLQDFDI